MMAAKTDLPVEKVYGLFCNESGYQTPKIDTRAAVFIDGKILLVHENNGTWSLPRWMVRCGSVHRIQHREGSFEETGCTVHSKKLIAVQDWRKHNVMNHAYGVIKTFMLCQYESGTFKSNIETTEIGLFDRTSLPQRPGD